MIPAHAAVSNTLVETQLTLAAQAHTASAWGAVYAQAMVYYAAAAIEPQVAAGVIGQGAGVPCPPPPPPGTEPVKPTVREPSTVYWERYLQLRSSRIATAPTQVRLC